MTDYAPLTATSGNISPKCSSLMSHRIRQADVARFQAALMDGLMPPSLPHPRRMVPRRDLGCLRGTAMAAETIAKALGGRKAGGGWVARCPAHDDRRPSLSLADGHDGRLLVKCWAGCSACDVLSALRRCELIGANKLRRVIDACGGTCDAEDRKKRAIDLWNAAFPISGTIAARYLLARGLALPSLTVLRFHPRCPHPSGANFPAMIGLVEHVNHGPTAIHRTFISPDGSGKAAVEPDKASLGPVAGGAVQLAEVRADQWLIIAEGLETTLSVMLACALPGWSALSAGGIKSLVLPPSANMVVICADNDANGAGQSRR
jgi:putative DNA primase/helicase